MSEAEFWRLTFAEAYLLTQQYWRQQARQDRGIALLLQRVINYTRGERDQPVTFEQVMQALGHQVDAPPPPPKPTVEELQTSITRLHGFYQQARDGQRG